MIQRLLPLVTIFGHAAGSQAAKLHQNPYAPSPFTHGADAAFHAGAIFMVLAAFVAMFLIRIRPQDGSAAPVTPA